MIVIFNNKDGSKKVNWIGYYQIIGGIIGLIFFLNIILSQYENLGVNSFLILIPCVFFSFSIFAGFSLLKQKKYGVRLTQINQIIQIPYIGMFGFAYQYYAGLFLGVGITGLLNFGFDLSISNFSFVLDNSNDEFALMLNIVPIIIINKLDRYLKSKSTTKENDVEIVSFENENTPTNNGS